MQNPCKVNHYHGLVIAYFGNSVAVEIEKAQVFQCYLRRNQPLPVVGDEVMLQIEDNIPLIAKILPRRNLLAKGDHKGIMKPLAANIDQLFIVMSPPPIFAEYLIDRYLAAATILNLNAVLVINKMDLLNEEQKADLETRLLAYEETTAGIIFSSTQLKQGLDDFSAHLQEKKGVLVGPSGVGKSSIIAALALDAEIKTQETHEKGGGKHTTTATRLYHLPNGGSLIDSPGVRDFNLWHVTSVAVAHSFKEFTEFSLHCKFKDCIHLTEPQCAVQSAVKNDKISVHRYANYQKLMQEALKNEKHPNKSRK